jgi:1,4-dihydroxy-2-naphthoate octaprenyltransferase
LKGLKVWFLETRPQFLTLSVVLAFLGTVIAWYDGYFNLWEAVLAGLDLVTRRTPFSGGSGILPAGLLSPRQVLWMGIVMLVLAMPIGIYFIIVRGWLLLPLLVLAVVFIVLYSPVILKRPWPEWAAGAGLGALPILGMYFSQSGVYTWDVVVACVPSAFLVHNLLLLNELPDADADTRARRKTLPITIGKKGAAIFYSSVAIAVFLWIIAWVAAGVMPVWSLLALLSLPLTVRAINGALHYNEPSRLMPGMAANVMSVLATQFLLGIGYILARAI